MSTPVMISWTRPKLEKFEKAYARAVQDKKKSFLFSDREFMTSYAKYLIEYLKTKL